MKCIIKFAGDFIIPKNLPHGEDPADEVGNDICQDSIGVVSPELMISWLELNSAKGKTRFDNFKDNGDHFLIFSNSFCQFEGARNALNAVWGIEFPDCEIILVESSIGNYPTLTAYDRARRVVLPLIRHFSSPASEERLVALENALDQIIDLNHLGNFKEEPILI